MGETNISAASKTSGLRSAGFHLAAL